jgi:hypothetical protein
MFERELTLSTFSIAYCQRLTADIEEARLGEIPAEGLKPPVWILGHLAIVSDMCRPLLGDAETKLCPDAWHKQFGPGSDSSRLPDPLPSKQDLVSAIDSGYRAIQQLAQGADPQAMAAPNPLPMPFLQQHLPTVGDLIALGQLSTWRRAAGLSEVF